MTDGRAATEAELAKFPDAKGKGHTVTKFGPDGKVLLRLGKPGVGARGTDTFLEPNDVITTPNGDIFVSDGHSGQNPNATPDTNARIVKFTKDGKYVKEWGKFGSAPGEFRTPHALALDSRGRLFVADRGNHRIQIFDQDGKFLEEWKQFGRVSGLFIMPTTRSMRSTPSRARSGIQTGRPAFASARLGKTRCSSSSRRTRFRPGPAMVPRAKASRSIAMATSTPPKVRSRARRREAG